MSALALVLGGVALGLVIAGVAVVGFVGSLALGVLESIFGG